MRLLALVVFVAILGGALGIAQTWSEFAGVEERMELLATVQTGAGGAVDAVAAADQDPADTTALPLAHVIGEPSNDFGILGRENSKSHSFVIRNDGTADLLVERQTVSCVLCVETTFEKAIVKPGEELTIPVTLSAHKTGPELNEALEVRTNDKTHEVIRFDLIAYISEAAGASVPEVAFGTVSTDKGAATSFRVYGFVDEELEIVEVKLRENGSEDYFEIEVEDLTEEAVKAGQSHAKFGKEIKVSIKPGAPVGPLNQSFTVVARAGEEVTINVPVQGRVTGDLSLIGGSKFSPDRSILSIGRILAGEGATARLQLMVKGEHRDDVQVSVGECDPAEYLSATIGERTALQSGYLFPITIVLGKDAPVVNRLGGVGASTGKIIIKTTHPTAKELKLYVSFAVE